MARSYFVETAAEAERVVQRLVVTGLSAAAEQTTHGYIVTVEAGPSVTVEEAFVRDAPSARRL